MGKGFWGRKEGRIVGFLFGGGWVRWVEVGGRKVSSQGQRWWGVGGGIRW